MLGWIGNVIQKVLINVLTFVIVGGLIYWFVMKVFF